MKKKKKESTLKVCFSKHGWKTSAKNKSSAFLPWSFVFTSNGNDQNISYFLPFQKDYLICQEAASNKT